MQYPALHLCVVIESRFSSRRTIQGDLKATDLFEHVVEADSVAHGEEILGRSDVDACIIGPSISPATSASFIQSVTKREAFQRCAFIVLVPPDSKPEEMSTSAAHSVQRYPCSKAQFSETVITAVLSANAESPWAQIRAQFGLGDPLKKETDDAPVDPAGAGVDWTAQVIGTPSGSGPSFERPTGDIPLRLAETIAECAPAIDQLTSGTFMFHPDGTPSRTLLRAVLDTCDAFCRTEPRLDTPEIRATLETLLIEFLRKRQAERPKEAQSLLFRGVAHIFKQFKEH